MTGRLLSRLDVLAVQFFLNKLYLPCLMINKVIIIMITFLPFTPLVWVQSLLTIMKGTVW